MRSETYTSLGKYTDQLLDAICVVDTQGRFVEVSAGCERIFGYTQAELIGRSMIEMVHPDDREVTLQTVERIVAGEAQPHFENRYLRKDGEVVYIMWSARWSEADQCRIAVARDITARKRIETMQVATYAISEAAHVADDLDELSKKIHGILGTLIPANKFCIALYDKQSGNISFPYVSNVPDVSHAQGQETALPELQNIDSHTAYAEVIRSGETLLNGDADVGEKRWLGVPLRSRKGTIGVLSVQSYQSSFSEQDKELLQFVSTQIANAIERTQMIERLHHLALFDQLTQLPNRQLFEDRLHLAMARAKRGHEQLALMFLDLDKFKQVNDAFGHSVGDILLEMVARRLELCVRESDTVARFGGDEFVVLLEKIDSPEQSVVVAENIRNSLRQPFELAGQLVSMQPSIGVAHYPMHGRDEKSLLAHADHAMYETKREQRGS